MMTADQEVMKELGPLLRDPRVRLLMKPFELETLKALLVETIKTNGEA
jgi:hypothetical protein